MSGRVRVVVYYSASAADPGSVVAAYRRVNGGMRGTPGLLSSQLLRSALDPGEFAVLSEWTGLAEFRAWEEGTQHKGQTSALRSYRDEGRGRGYGVYEVVDEF
ncbi:antibiotic biosynthesis monooxygenase family protein [Nonomuraea africana]|uniref:Heme-degrading monooxygenase HmoA n=1 Tax=Nonomuraea africana TaxID=46171 RepID=A0ABR9KJY6_9ACTN|nr:antibiotic biosynthesis monooxygenase family protein [Nonomuraea africana]MBE1561852.1 heme-degrading monooxygenase HmoA [Nonomuraea africana]